MTVSFGGSLMSFYSLNHREGNNLLPSVLSLTLDKYSHYLPLYFALILILMDLQNVLFPTMISHVMLLLTNTSLY